MDRPTVNALYESGQYQLVESFTIDEMAQFLAREAGLLSTDNVGGKASKKPGLLLILLLLAAGGSFGWLIGSAFTYMDTGEALIAPGWQLLITLPIFLLGWLPVHEAIHAIFFKLLGAPRVGFGYAPKGLMVYAYAQRFVMTLRENALVAAMPFLIITFLLAALFVSVPGLTFMWGFTLLIHTLGCMGDFILIKYAWQNRHRAMYTYDDLDEKRTYFFEKQ